MIESLDYKVLYQDGCFRRVVYFYEGWEKVETRGKVVYTHGWRGRETHVYTEEIFPSVTFEIKEEYDKV